MTRETKVGLLIGLGLILLIGIIVSDYLSVAQMQEPAALTEFGPRAAESIRDEQMRRPAMLAETAVPASRYDRPIPTPQELAPYPSAVGTTGSPAQPQPRPDAPIAMGPTGPAYVPLLSSTDAGRTAPAEPAGVIPTPTEMTLSELAPPPPMFGRDSMAAAPLDQRDRQTPAAETITSARYAPRPTTVIEQTPPAVPAPQPSRNTIVHHVQEGETLFEIAQKYYGDGEQWRTIARTNADKVRENGHVGVGVRLVLPAQPDRRVTDLVEAANAALASRPVAPVVTSARTVSVREGDTLIGLARQHLGDGNRWEELLEANRGKLDSPRDLRVGMQLNLPATGATVITSNTRNRPSTPASRGGTYTVREGDNLYRIAERTLGDRDRWQDIYQANRDKLDSPDSIRVGQTLKLPS